MERVRVSAAKVALAEVPPWGSAVIKLWPAFTSMGPIFSVRAELCDVYSRVPLREVNAVPVPAVLYRAKLAPLPIRSRSLSWSWRISSSVGPLRTIVLAALRVPPVLPEISMRPSLMTTVPVKAFAPVRAKESSPFFTRVPSPVITPAKVTVSFGVASKSEWLRVKVWLPMATVP